MRRIEQHINEEPEFSDLAQLIENDLAFSYEILRLVNSAYFGRIIEIKSIRSALIVLGLNEIRKWLYLAFISDLSEDTPEELIHSCMLRGKFLEYLALQLGRKELAAELLTLGMFSRIDLLLGRPITEILDEMHFSDNIRLILSGQMNSGFLADCYNLVLNYEAGEWDKVEINAESLGISSSNLNQAYLSSLKWMKNIQM